MEDTNRNSNTKDTNDTKWRRKMKIKNVEVYGFRASFRGMRNSYDSWEKSDSIFPIKSEGGGRNYFLSNREEILTLECPFLGPEDLRLAQKLIKAGSSHRKFMRQIMIWVDFILPRYVFTELDTYKVATVRNSCSTMHTINKRLLTPEDFEDQCITQNYLDELNGLIKLMQENKGNGEFFSLKAMLPEGFLQLSTFSFSYETALNMYQQRKSHRLPEWNNKEENQKYSICRFIEELPYAKMLILPFAKGEK